MRACGIVSSIGRRALPVRPNMDPSQSRVSDTANANAVATVSASPKSEAVQYQLEALSERWQIYLAIIYTFTAITSFLLNAMTVIVLARCRRSELRKYLINLSMSDLLMSLLSIRKYICLLIAEQFEASVIDQAI